MEDRAQKVEAKVDWSRQSNAAMELKFGHVGVTTRIYRAVSKVEISKAGTNTG